MVISNIFFFSFCKVVLEVDCSVEYILSIENKSVLKKKLFLKVPLIGCHCDYQ